MLKTCKLTEESYALEVNLTKEMKAEFVDKTNRIHRMELNPETFVAQEEKEE